MGNTSGKSRTPSGDPLASIPLTDSESAAFKSALALFTPSEAVILRQTFTDLAERSVPSSMIDRATFLKVFPLPGIIGERLFDMFDTRDAHVAGEGSPEKEAAAARPSARDNMVDYFEFVCGMAVMCRGSADARHAFIFRMWNMTGDGLMTRAELRVLLNQVPRPLVYTLLYGVAPDAPVLSTLTHVWHTTVVASIVARAFEVHDADKDGRLNEAEFKAWLRVTPAIVDYITSVFPLESTPATGGGDDSIRHSTSVALSSTSAQARPRSWSDAMYGSSAPTPTLVSLGSGGAAAGMTPTRKLVYETAPVPTVTLPEVKRPRGESEGQALGLKCAVCGVCERWDAHTGSRMTTTTLLAATFTGTAWRLMMAAPSSGVGGEGLNLEAASASSPASGVSPRTSALCEHAVCVACGQPRSAADLSRMDGTPVLLPTVDAYTAATASGAPSRIGGDDPTSGGGADDASVSTHTDASTASVSASVSRSGRWDVHFHAQMETKPTRRRARQVGDELTHLLQEAVETSGTPPVASAASATDATAAVAPPSSQPAPVAHSHGQSLVTASLYEALDAHPRSMPTYTTPMAGLARSSSVRVPPSPVVAATLQAAGMAPHTHTQWMIQAGAPSPSATRGSHTLVGAIARAFTMLSMYVSGRPAQRSASAVDVSTGVSSTIVTPAASPETFVETAGVFHPNATVSGTTWQHYAALLKSQMAAEKHPDMDASGVAVHAYTVGGGGTRAHAHTHAGTRLNVIDFSKATKTPAVSAAVSAAASVTGAPAAAATTGVAERMRALYTSAGEEETVEEAALAMTNAAGARARVPTAAAMAERAARVHTLMAAATTTPMHTYMSVPAGAARALRNGGVEAIEHEGNLYKIGARFGTRTRRWYYLQNNFLYWYSTQREGQPRGALFLEGSTCTPLGENGVRIHTSSVHGDRTRVLYASSTAKRDEWVSALRRACRAIPFDEEYDLGPALGAGRFSRVYSCTRRSTGEAFAVKVIEQRSLNEQERELLRTEIAILKLVQHPHIVRLENVYETGTHMNIVMELLEGGELFNNIVGRARFSEDEARELAKPLIESVAYLHSLGIVHRDIKPENILCGKRLQDVKIADFGLSKLVHPGEVMTMPCGTINYTAPEVLTREGYGKEADLWSIGIILWLVVRGRLPFDAPDKETVVRNTLQAKLDFASYAWASWSEEGRDFMRGLLEKDPKKRLSARRALQHAWLRGSADADVHSAAAAAIAASHVRAGLLDADPLVLDVPASPMAPDTARTFARTDASGDGPGSVVRDAMRSSMEATAVMAQHLRSSDES